MKFENNIEKKATIKFGDNEYTLVWNKEENNWVGKMGSITFKIYEKNH